MTHTACKAKNPATCRYHGSFTRLQEQMDEASKRGDFKAYEAARTEWCELERNLEEAELKEDIRRRKELIREMEAAAESGDIQAFKEARTKLDGGETDRDRVIYGLSKRIMKMDWEELSYLARHPDIPEEFLTALACTDKSGGVDLLLGRDTLPLETYSALLRHPDYQIVHFRVAKHKGTPAGVLDSLGNHEHVSVRAAVAENPNTSKRTLARLSADEEVWVRGNVAENPNTPEEIVVRLSRDESEGVCSLAKEHPAYQEHQRKQFAAEAGIDRDALPAELLDELMA